MADEITTNEGLLPIGRETIESGLGDINTTIANIFRGFNHRGGAVNVPDNKDNQGYTFFTRPRLNLTYDNAYVSRKLRPYLTDDKSSILRAIRVYLDPLSQRGMDANYLRGGLFGETYESIITIEAPDRVDSPLVDKDSPFIHILSGTLLSLTGWPDETLDTYTSEPGVMKESYSIVDTYIDNYEVGDLTATFRNVKGDVITLLFRAWMEYCGRVVSGEMLPWVDSLIEFEIDYETRIWRIVTDVSGRKVTKIGSALAGIPTANPIGQSMNYDVTRPYSEDTKEISVPFKSVGFEVNDPILVEEFNDTVFMFNPAVEKAVNDYESQSEYSRVPNKWLDYFTHELVMTIDEETWLLQWWCKRVYFEQIKEEFNLS